MRTDDFFEEEPDPPLFAGGRRFRDDLAKQLRVGPLTDRSDIEVAVPLARLVHNELEAYGTRGGQELRDEDMGVALLALRAILDRRRALRAYIMLLLRKTVRSVQGSGLAPDALHSPLSPIRIDSPTTQAVFLAGIDLQ